MIKTVIFGLGNFGINTAKTLIDNKSEVLGIDIDKEIITSYKDLLTHIVCGDATNKDVLKSLHIEDFDAAVVAIGQDMTASILISMYLLEMNLKKIIVRAISEDHVKILKKIGIEEIVFPEKDTAEKIANKISMKNVIDFLPVSGNYGIVELIPPKSFHGKTLKELNITQRYRCQIIGIKYLKEEPENSITQVLEKTIMAPSAGDHISFKSVMIVLGKIKDIEKLRKAN